MTAHPPSDGWLWIKQGLQLFRRNPGEMLALNLAYMSGFSCLSIIPGIGQLIWLSLVPACCLGMMQACRQLSQGQSVWSQALLNGLLMPHLARQLKLGAMWVLATVLASLAVASVFALLDDQVSWQILSGQIPASSKQLDAGNLLIASSCAALVYLPFVMALWFAPALVNWRDMPASKAIFYSFFAVWRSGRAFIIYGLGLIGLFFTGIFFSGLISIPLVLVFAHPQLISTAVALALLLIMFSIFYCTLYCTYEQVFGAEKLENLDAP